MTKELARVLARVLRAVYNRLDDVGIAVVPTGPIIEYPSSWGVQVNKSGEITTLRSEIAVLEEIKEMTD